MEIRYTLCDLLAPPEVLKKYMTKDKDLTDGCPYNFDLNKVEKNTKTKRTAIANWNMVHWGTKQNVSNAGYNPGSDSVSFWCNGHCPDVAIKKIFTDNPKVPIMFYWFNENDEKEHYYIRTPENKILIRNGQGVLRK